MAAVATTTVAAQPPVSAQVVGNAFVQQYYHIQHQSPELVHRFYQDISKLGRPDDNGTMNITTTMLAIDEKILSLNYGELRAEIKSVDAQESFNGGVHVLVTGYLVGKDNMIRNFTQTFFLAPQEKGYFVLNDMFRYMEDIKHHNGNQSFTNEVEAPLTPEQDSSPVQENHVSEQTVVTVEVIEEEALNPTDNGEVSVVEVEEEVPVAEVVDEVPDESQVVVESNSRIEGVPKKSYASIVMVMRESAMPLSSPAPAPRRPIAKSQEQPVNLVQASATAVETPVSGSDAIENGNNQEGEGMHSSDGYSIYIKGLPLNATPALLEDEFKRFGPIKSDGIQVRSNKQQGFCFGFVEFEVESAVQKAIEASPVTIGGRQAFVEEKRSTNSRVNNNRGRFSTGRGSGFRNEGVRGRANYGSGRGYNRGDFNGRTEFGNNRDRGSNRGGFSSRGGDGYQRSDSMGSNGGGRANRGGGMAVNATAKTVAPRVSISLFLCAFLGMLKMWFNLDPLVPFSPNPCWILHQEPSFRDGFSISQLHNNVGDVEKRDEEQVQEQEQSEFWKQPDGLGYKPCLDFTREYKKWSGEIVKDRKNYLMVVVSGGMNQQRNQIVDAVVIARILGAALVVPVLQVNVIWGDESEFSDIFDLEHFKKVLANDVRIVSSLPSTHLMSRPVEDRQMPVNVNPQWIRAHYHRRLRRDGVLLIRGFDSKLSKDLPSDLQKLRCKVAFQALKFAPPILELGNMLTERMRSKGPYLALHLRLEKDVWVRTGCLPGLSHEYDEMISNERKLRPELLTSKSKMTYHERKLAGLCPLNALDVTRLLKALGAPKNARIYWAGGNPLGGKEALLPLIREFPNLYNKEDLVLPGELEPFASKASVLAAIDYIVADNSDVFMPSHGGNMGHAIQGHRAFAGHKKYITPNKRQMLPYFLNASLPEAEFNRIIMDLHQDSLGQPDLRTSKAGRDVTKFPAPGCMCNDSNSHSS